MMIYFTTMFRNILQKNFSSTTMKTLSSNCYRSAAEKSFEIIFTADIFDFDVTLNNSQNQNVTSSSSLSEKQRQRQDTSHTETSKTASRKSASNHYVILQNSVLTQRLSLIHSAFRLRLIFNRANDVIALNDWIARNDETTFTYEQLSHRLRILKQHQSTTSAKCVIKLTRTNDYLLQELTYYKDTQAADMKFFKKVIKTHADLKDALKKRSQRRANAKFTLLSYWDIDFDDDNVKDTVF